MLNRHPTPFADLNAVLGELVDTAGAILGENFCGAYLQGSFAVGDADIYSDVDFVVVTHDEVSAPQEEALRSLHARFPAREIEWAKHLEGSYIPKDALRRIDPDRAPYLYVDNGSAEMERSNHDNTAVVRWVLREHGIALAGPEPKTLIDVVSADDLRGEVCGKLRRWTEELRDYTAALDTPWSAWLQPYVVLSYCRMLLTLEVGRVISKRTAGLWALDALDQRWAPLIRRALDDRPDPWQRVHRPADPAAIEETWHFIEYALPFAGMPQP